MAFSRISCMPSFDSRGSAEVEAALILPLAVLIIVGMLRLSTALYDNVVASSEENSSAAAVLVEGGRLPTESILRGRWHLK